MSKVKNQTPATYTGKAVTSFKCKDGDGLLAVSAILSIVNGKVTSVEILGAPDLPASALGKAQQELWKQLRTQTIEAT